MSLLAVRLMSIEFMDCRSSFGSGETMIEGVGRGEGQSRKKRALGENYHELDDEREKREGGEKVTTIPYYEAEVEAKAAG